MPAAVENKNDIVSLVMAKQHNESSKLSENSKFIEDQVWGFRITGGSEFGMPITVFHVRVLRVRVHSCFFLSVYCVLFRLNLVFYSISATPHTCMLLLFILIFYEKTHIFYVWYCGEVYFVYFNCYRHTF